MIKFLKYLLLFLPLVTGAQNLRISDMPTASDVVGAYVPIVQLGINKKAAASLFGGVSSVSGTTNRITSTGGATPVIDISASYVGQSSITTLGTISTGIWQGTPIADAYISSASNWNVAYANRITSLTTTGSSGASTLVSNVLNIPNYTAAGLAAWALSSGGTLTGPNIVTGTTSNTLKFVFNSLGTTQTNGAGIWLQNPIPAANLAQQISPSITWEGQGWKSQATAASQSVKFTSYVLPIQGLTTPTGSLNFDVSINGGAYSSKLKINSVGTVTIPGSIIVGNSLNLSILDGIIQTNTIPLVLTSNAQPFSINSVAETGDITIGNATGTTNLNLITIGDGLGGGGIFLTTSNLGSILMTDGSQTVSIGGGSALTYGADYSATFAAQTLIDKHYADTHVMGGTILAIANGGTGSSTQNFWGTHGLTTIASGGAQIEAGTNNVFVGVNAANTTNAGYISTKYLSSTRTVVNLFVAGSATQDQAFVQIESNANVQKATILVENNSSQSQTLTFDTSASGIIVSDGITAKGLVYNNDYSSNYTAQSLIDKNYADTHIIGLTAPVSSTGFLYDNAGTLSWTALSAGNGITVTAPGTIALGGTISTAVSLTHSNTIQNGTVLTISDTQSTTGGGTHTTFALTGTVVGRGSGIGFSNAINYAPTAINKTFESIYNQPTITDAFGSSTFYGYRSNITINNTVGTSTVYGMYLDVAPVSTTGVTYYGLIIGTSLASQNGIGATPTALWHLAVGSSGSAGTAPLKVASGTLLSSTEIGAVETDGTNLYWTDNSNVRWKLNWLNNALSVDNASLQLNSGTTFDGSAARTISVKAGGVTNAMLANSSITIAGNVTSLGGSVTQDNITGLSSTGIIKRTAANTLAIAVAGTDYLTPSGSGASLSGVWLAASGVTMSAANTITGTTPSGLLFTNTWTATASNQNAIEYAGTLTARSTASDVMRYFVIDPTLVSSAATQTLTAELVNPTFTDTNSATKYISRYQNAGSDRVTFGFDGAVTVTSGNSSTNPTIKTIGIGTGTNYSLRNFQSDGSTEIFSLKDNGLLAHTPLVPSSIFSATYTATANSQTAYEFAGTVTSRNTASDTWNYLTIDPTMARNAGNPASQIANVVFINGTFSNTPATQNLLKVQNAGQDRLVLTGAGLMTITSSTYGWEVVGTTVTLFSWTGSNGQMGTLSNHDLQVMTNGGGANQGVLTISKIGNVTIENVTSSNTPDIARLYLLQPALSASWKPVFRADPGPNTAMTAGTEFKVGLFSGSTQTWANGSSTLATQRYWHFAAETVNAGTGNTITDTYNVSIDDPTNGSGTTTNLWSLGVGKLRMGGIPKFAGTNTTGAGSAALGANSPAVTNTAPYTWIQIITSDGSTAYIPVWK